MAVQREFESGARLRIVGYGFLYAIPSLPEKLSTCSRADMRMEPKRACGVEIGRRMCPLERRSKMMLSKAAGSSFLILALCFSALPGFAQGIRDEKAAMGNVQHWLRKNTVGATKEESAIFYVNTEDQGKILIFTRNDVYLLETRYASVVRVTTPIEKTESQFETHRLATAPLRDVTATVQPIAGWHICFREAGEPPSPSDCHLFTHYAGDSPSKGQDGYIATPPPRSWSRRESGELKPVKRDPIKPSNLQKSELIRRVDPVYPESAKRARVEGRVLLAVTVDEEGSVFEIRVIAGHPLLVEAALSAVRQWKYSPTLLDGKPVAAIITVTVRFSFAASGETAITVAD
jgi:TonB family protein